VTAFQGLIDDLLEFGLRLRPRVGRRGREALSGDGRRVKSPREMNGIDFDHFFHVLLRYRRVTD
jgi:hypothetical protein